MVHKHEDKDDCDCDHHHHKTGGHAHDDSNPCHVEMFVEKLLKNLDVKEEPKED